MKKETNEFEAVLIKTNETIMKITISKDEQEQKKQLQNLVGGHFEIITDLAGKLLVINGTGLLKGLTENWYASLLIGQPNRLVGDIVVIDDFKNVKNRLKLK